MKRLFILLLCVFLSVNIIVPVHASDDTEGPTIQSITVDKHEVKEGETVTVTMKVTDESGIYYESTLYCPVIVFKSSKGTDIYVYLETKIDENTFEGTYTVDESSINGKYVFSSASVYDSLKNRTYQPSVNYSYPNLYFTVSGANDDSEGPVIQSITVDKHEVKEGETVTVTMKVTDESGIYYESTLYCPVIVFKSSKGTNIYVYLETKIDENTFEGTYTVDESSINGKYVFSSASVYDSLKNRTYQPSVNYSYPDLYFTILHDPMYDLIPAFDNVYVYPSTTTVSNTVFDGDVYIGKSAVLTMRNCTVNGNIYVVGVLKASSIVVNELHAREVIWGYVSQYYNGTVSISGTNSIKTTIVSNYPITSIPYRIDFAETKDGILEIAGVVADVTDFYINDVPVSLFVNKLHVDDLNVGDVDFVTLKWVTPFGNTITVDIPVDKLVRVSDDVWDSKPVIKATDVTLCVGSDVSPLDYVTVTDKEDADIMDHLEYDVSDVDVNIPGQYVINYSVTDSHGVSTSVTCTVTIVEHEYDVTERAEPTCLENGHETRVCRVCNHEETIELAAIGHDYELSYWNWSDDYENVSAVFICNNDLTHIENVDADVQITEENTKKTVYEAVVTFEGEEYRDTKIVWHYDVTRIYGDNRYETSLKSAEELRTILGVDKFEAVVLTTGSEYADALSGSYLANINKAPVILIRGNTKSKPYADNVINYIKNNVRTGGTVYVLGGDAAVPDEWLTGLEGYELSRIAGTNRYLTNIAILNESGYTGGEILVCTGKDFADSLSASAVDLPILLVNGTGKLNSKQKEYLETVDQPEFIIIGGENAVSKEIEDELSQYGNIEDRIAGSTRYETSKLIAEEFYGGTDKAVLAYGQNYPDGLSGGALAYTLKSPLILADSRPKRAQFAIEFCTGKEIVSGYVLGGNTLITDEYVRQIFSLEEEVVIVEK